MSVYVDDLLSCLRSKMWGWSSACHLFADTLDGLHTFAAEIGLKREWFQNRPGFPHYDLTPSKRIQAVHHGAKEVGRREVADYMRLLREASLRVPNKKETDQC